MCPDEAWVTEAVLCPSCGRRVGGRPARCLYCGVSLAAVQAHEPRRCPRCSRNMKVTPVQGGPIDTCEFCRGQFFDSFEVDRALALTGDQSQRLQRLESPVPTDTSDGQPLSCPGCRQMMRTWELPGPPKVWLDRCRNCKGIWLDGGEVRKLLQALAAAGSPLGCNGAKSAGTEAAQGQARCVAPRPSSESNAALGLFFSLLDFIVPGD